MALVGNKKKKKLSSRRPSFIDLFRSLGNSAQKQAAKSTNAAATTPATAPASPTTATADGGDTVIAPKVRRSRSFGDAYLFSRRQSLQTSGYTFLERSTPSVIDEDGGEDVDSETGKNTVEETRDRQNEDDGMTPPSKYLPSRRDSGAAEKITKVDYYTGGYSAVTLLSDLRSNSPREKVLKSGRSFEKTDRTVDFVIGDPRDGGTLAAATLDCDVNQSQGKSGGRDRNSSGDKGNRKSVCVVAPSEMKLRRSNSERFSPEPKGQLKTALAPRRSTITTTSRKSMPSLAALEQQTQHDLEQNSESLESQRETRRSGGSATTGSGSNGGEILVLQLDNSSSKLSSDVKKIPDPNELPPHVSKSKNAKFHKLFKSVPIEEYPIDSYSCAFKGDILLQGMMYVSPNWICFYSKIRARGRLLEIPFEKIISITREKLALIIPNAIGIQIADQKYVFGSFMSRDNTYKLLVTVWKHSQDSTDSANTKENDLSCYDDFASNQSRRALHSSTPVDDDITHSADISGESDTTEDDSESEGNDCHAENGPSSFTGGRASDVTGGDGKRETSSDKVPGFFSLRCIDCRKIFTALSTFAVKLQKIPRTNLLLAVCSMLVVFLLMSAVGLTYKILLLQTRLEMSHLWTPGRQQSFRDQVMGNIYTLQSETQKATIHQLHNVLKANIQLLEQVQQSLKSLQGYSTWSSSPPQECPPPK